MGCGTRTENLPGFITICRTLAARWHEELEFGVPCLPKPIQARAGKRQPVVEQGPHQVIQNANMSEEFATFALDLTAQSLNFGLPRRGRTAWPIWEARDFQSLRLAFRMRKPRCLPRFELAEETEGPRSASMEWTNPGTADFVPVSDRSSIAERVESALCR